MRINELETPALVLDRSKLDRNLQRMHAHVHALGCRLRPHVKTAKSIDVVRRALEGEPGGITVSTLKEAEHFFGHGIRDIVYAVGIAPAKFAHVVDLIQRGTDLKVILDNVAAARALAQFAHSVGASVPVLIELDVDGHRSGVPPQSSLLLEVAHVLTNTPGVSLHGVLTHAGDAYNCRSTQALEDFAERERAGAVQAAQRLRDAGMNVPTVSVGSTPTATFSRNLNGVTEVRAGVYMFQDLVMAGVGVCSVEDIALSVLVSVIGHRPDRHWLITDGGWTALSRDRGTSSQSIDQGYGLVLDINGQALAEDLIVAATNQEHGVISRRGNLELDLSKFPVGTFLRILPNHACATGTQHEAYYVIEGDDPTIEDRWQRFSGW